MAATILCVLCGQPPQAPFTRLYKMWYASFLVLKNTDNWQKFTDHMMCGSCQLNIFRDGRKSYDCDPGWDERESKKYATTRKWSEGLDETFLRKLSESERDLRDNHGWWLEVSDYVFYPPGRPHSPQCQAIDGAPQASFTGSGDDGQMDVDK